MAPKQSRMLKKVGNPVDAAAPSSNNSKAGVGT